MSTPFDAGGHSSTAPAPHPLYFQIWGLCAPLLLASFALLPLPFPFFFFEAAFLALL
jgi:hypothetical protein